MATVGSCNNFCVFFKTIKVEFTQKHFKSYPISGVNEAGVFLLDEACCSSSNTLNKLSPKGSAMIFTFVFPQYNTRLSRCYYFLYGSRAVQNSTHSPDRKAVGCVAYLVDDGSLKGCL